MGKLTTTGSDGDEAQPTLEPSGETGQDAEGFAAEAACLKDVV